MCLKIKAILFAMIIYIPTLAFCGDIAKCPPTGILEGKTALEAPKWHVYGNPTQGQTYADIEAITTEGEASLVCLEPNKAVLEGVMRREKTCTFNNQTFSTKSNNRIHCTSHDPAQCVLKCEPAD